MKVENALLQIVDNKYKNKDVHHRRFRFPYCCVVVSGISESLGYFWRWRHLTTVVSEYPST